MQVYAFDRAGLRTFADKARKRHDYFCMECGQVLRMRSGFKTRKHFFHLKSEKKCSLHKKSLKHILLQELIVQQIQRGSGEICEQEVSFLHISRIADVAWHSKQIVFEVQCSPMQLDEMKKRTEDYASIGWYVIWILLDTRFLQRKNSAIHSFLQNRTHYYASARENIIYDFCPHFIESKRLCIVDLATLSVCQKPSDDIATGFLQKRMNTWRYYAKQDLIWLKLTYPNALFLQSSSRPRKKKA